MLHNMRDGIFDTVAKTITGISTSDKTKDVIVERC